MIKNNLDSKFVTLTFYQPKHKEKLFAFDLPVEKKKFTGMPIDTLSISIEDPCRYPVVILANDTAVGFFICM
jgi:hypothetical protein